MVKRILNGKVVYPKIKTVIGGKGATFQEYILGTHFTKEQFALIQYYLYKVPSIEDWDGMIDITDGKDVITVKFETPDQVWTVISSLK